MRLVTPHDPIQVGTTGDRWNAIRPLVGYGPETLSIVYEDFYLPEMFAVERYDLEHEHAHNEFWDVLAHYGILGFFVEYGFFLCLIYFALKWLGWISSGREVRVYWLASLLGGLFGGIAAWAFAGTEFLGLGIPLGLLLGAVATLLLRMLRNDSITVVKPDLWRDMLLVSSLAMVIFHYVEILFGISVQTSRVFFWIVCGMMLALGQGSLAESRDLKEMPRIGLHAGIVTAILMALIPLFTVLHDFGQDILTIIVNALAFNSFSILWMFLGIALFSSLLFELGDAVIAGRKFSFKSLAWLLGIVFFISALVWMLYASQLALIWKSPDLRPLQVVALYVRMLTAQFVALVVFAYAAAFLFSDTSGAPVTNPKPLVAAGFVLAQVLALALSFYINLRPFQANGIAGLFNNYVKYNQYPAAIEVSGEILKLDPSQDIYYTSVADAAMEYAGMLAGRQNVTGYVLMAEERAKRAYNLNPLYYRNRMVMAKVNRVWARITPDPAARKVRIDQAEKFYADFLESRPYRVKLWVEWADFRAEFDDMQGARQKVDAALKIDKTYTLAYMVSANLYLKAADKQESPAKRAELWKLALTDLQMQIQTTRSEDNPAFAWLQLGDVHVLLQQDEQARDAYLQAEQLGLGNFQWEVYKKLAEVSGRLNDTAAQRGYLQQAIAAAPAEEVAGLQSVLDSLKP
jgi:tetratricopeptide (TPR) repeat protein